MYGHLDNCACGMCVDNARRMHRIDKLEKEVQAQHAEITRLRKTWADLHDWVLEAQNLAIRQTRAADKLEKEVQAQHAEITRLQSALRAIQYTIDLPEAHRIAEREVGPRRDKREEV